MCQLKWVEWDASPLRLAHPRKFQTCCGRVVLNRNVVCSPNRPASPPTISTQETRNDGGENHDESRQANHNPNDGAHDGHIAIHGRRVCKHIGWSRVLGVITLSNFALLRVAHMEICCHNRTSKLCVWILQGGKHPPIDCFSGVAGQHSGAGFRRQRTLWRLDRRSLRRATRASCDLAEEPTVCTEQVSDSAWLANPPIRARLGRPLITNLVPRAFSGPMLKRPWERGCVHHRPSWLRYQRLGNHSSVLAERFRWHDLPQG